MNPSDRLWVELIFPRCEPTTLLALRAVCRVWLAQLNAAPARLWLPLTMELARMSYAERVLGWPGVAVAMRREESTRANCDAGRYTQRPEFALAGNWHVLLAGGRVAAFSGGDVQLFDADTGAQLAAFEVDGGYCTIEEHAVCDRWIAFSATDGRALLLDCVAARLVQLSPPRLIADIDVFFSVAGPCVALRAVSDTAVAVVHISGGPDGATAAREVARVELSHADHYFALCERGRSYVLYDSQRHTVQLFDVVTGQCKRAFTPCACYLARRCDV